MHWILVIAISQAAPPAKRVSAVDLISGGLSLVATRRCGGSSEVPAEVLEWPAFVYDRKPPQGKGNGWRPKRLLGCHGGTWVLTEAIAAGALWGQMDHQKIEADAHQTLLNGTLTHEAFKTEFGWEPPAHGAIAPNVLPTYEAKKIEALFDRLYLKPADPVGALTGQAIYDLILKSSVTRFLREAVVLKKKLPAAKLKSLAKEYQAAAKEQGESFNGPTYLAKVVEKQLGPADDESPIHDGRTLGTMLRRTADGTWPTVTKLLNKLVKAYDPPLAKEIAAGL